MAEKKTLEINLKLKLKNMPIEEYESIMKPYRRNILQFERSLRQLADSGVISYKILDNFTAKFKFASLQRMRFSSPDEQDYSQPQTVPQTPQVAPQQPGGFSFGQTQPQATPQQSEGFGFGQTQQQPASTGFGSQATAQRPQSSFGTNQQNFTESSQPQSAFGQPAPDQSQQRASTGFNSPNNRATSGGLGSLSDTTPPSPAPSFSPSTTPNPSTPSFGISSGFGGNTPAPKQDSKISIGVDEEDRATGIAILRKKMLMELRKIRNVVEQEDSDTF